MRQEPARSLCRAFPNVAERGMVVLSVIWVRKRPTPATVQLSLSCSRPSSERQW